MIGSRTGSSDFYGWGIKKNTKSFVNKKKEDEMGSCESVGRPLFCLVEGSFDAPMRVRAAGIGQFSTTGAVPKWPRAN